MTRRQMSENPHLGTLAIRLPLQVLGQLYGYTVRSGIDLSAVVEQAILQLLASEGAPAGEATGVSRRTPRRKA
ncbi:MAG: hypothetical protein ABSF61_01500 [Anaerolineales bacterium]|jgi:hypothetical protein